jgi:hypothetical protein
MEIMLHGIRTPVAGVFFGYVTTMYATGVVEKRRFGKSIGTRRCNRKVAPGVVELGSRDVQLMPEHYVEFEQN